MKVHKMRKVFGGLMGLVVALFLVGWIGDLPLISGIAVGVLLATSLCFWVFWRCPHCGRNLGTLSARHCPNCGAKLDIYPGEDPYEDVNTGRYNKFSKDE